MQTAPFEEAAPESALRTPHHEGPIVPEAANDHAAGAWQVKGHAQQSRIPEVEQIFEPSRDMVQSHWNTMRNAVRSDRSLGSSKAYSDWMQVLDSEGLSQQLQHVRGMWGRTIQEASATARIYEVSNTDRRIGTLAPTRPVHEDRPPLILSSRPSPLLSPGHVSPSVALASSPIDELDAVEASIFQQLSDLQVSCLSSFALWYNERGSCSSRRCPRQRSTL